jgi:N-formylglutamate deformylase
VPAGIEILEPRKFSKPQQARRLPLLDIPMPLTPRSSAFVLITPRSDLVPIVFDSPHSGFEFPSDFRPIATRAQIRTTWDAYVDELCAGVVDAGATLLAARFPRAYIDVNRAADDIDPEVLDTPWPAPVAPSDYSTRGMGLIRRFALRGVPMYDRRLTVAEVAARIDDFYTPYRRALQAALDGAWRRYGAVWHFNCHSMKSQGRSPARGRRVERADFVIGDRHGTTAPPDLTAWVATFFSTRGYRVEINRPYRGADIVRTHGDPARRRYSLQIEINRALYMNEASGVRRAGLTRLQRELGDFARAMAGHARSELARTDFSQPSPVHEAGRRRPSLAPRPPAR